MEKLRAAGAAERVARGLPAEGLELGFGGGARLCDEFCFGRRVWEEVYIQAHPQVMLGSAWPSLSILGISTRGLNSDRWANPVWSVSCSRGEGWWPASANPNAAVGVHICAKS